MRILVNALSARFGGGITYIRSLLQAIAEVDHRNEYHVLLSGRYQRQLMHELQPCVAGIVDADLAPYPLLRRWWFEQSEIPRLLRRSGYDLLFTSTEAGTIIPGRPHVVTVHNPWFFAPLKAFPPGSQRRLLLRYRCTRLPLVYLTLRRCDRMMFVSEVFREQVTRQLRLHPRKGVAIHHGVNKCFFASPGESRRGERRPYILAVSTVSPHKNYETLLDAYADLRVELGGDVPELIVAGDLADSDTWRRLQAQIDRLALAKDVRFVGRVDHHELPPLFRGASAYVLPSRLETFGLPLVEAMACGVPLVAADLPVCREVCGDAALYHPPADKDALRAHLATLLQDRQRAEVMVERGLVRAREFRWERTARKVVAVLEEAGGAGMQRSALRHHARTVLGRGAGS